MVTIKLRRIGKKKEPFYNIIAIEKSAYINGKHIEKLGYFDPIRKYANTNINIDKIKDWIKKGAILSKRVQNLIKCYEKHKNK